MICSRFSRFSSARIPAPLVSFAHLYAPSFAPRRPGPRPGQPSIARLASRKRERAVRGQDGARRRGKSRRDDRRLRPLRGRQAPARGKHVARRGAAAASAASRRLRLARPARARATRSWTEVARAASTCTSSRSRTPSTPTSGRSSRTTTAPTSSSCKTARYDDEQEDGPLRRDPPLRRRRGYVITVRHGAASELAGARSGSRSGPTC